MEKEFLPSFLCASTLEIAFCGFEGGTVCFKGSGKLLVVLHLVTTSSGTESPLS